jgi:threonine dehydrogenase-like Zn-dependent dehydrogenase
VEIRELPVPRTAPGEVVVRTVCSGISTGTERLIFRGDVPEDVALDDTIKALAGTFRYPFPYGYACVGRVEGQDGLVFAFHPHQDTFAAAASDLIALPAVGPAAGTLFPLVETALQITLDASANAEAPARALDILAHEGTLLIASWFGSQPVPMPLGGAFHRRRLTIRSTQVSTIPARMSATWTMERRRAEAAALLPELPLDELCTHRFPFAAAADAFRAVDENAPGLMHAVLDYDGGPP